MRPDDLALLRVPGAPAVAPDGQIAVVAVTRHDVAENGPRSQLWAVPTDGSTPSRPLTSGGRDTAPAFSPDGRWLAYLGAARGQPPQVHVLPTAGGAPRRLTDAPLGAGAPVWSPDSRRLAWTAHTGEPEDPDAPRLITSLRIRPAGVGPLGDRRSQVHVLDLPDDLADDDAALPEPVVLTHGEADCTDVCWRPDGAELAFVSARHATADRDLRTDVFTVRPDGSGLRRITDTRGRCSRPAWSPDGAALVLTAVPDLGPDGLDLAGRQHTLCRVPAAGGSPEPLLDGDDEVHVDDEVHADDEVPGPVVTDRGVLVAVRRRGAVELQRVPLTGGPAEALVDGPFTVRGMGAGAGVVVATVAHDGSAGELIAITPGRRRLLTAFGSGLAATGRVHRAAERRPAGDSPTRGWVTVPPGTGPHPVVLDLHEGPAGWSLDVDVQVAVSAGFAVVRGDPRDGDGVLTLLDAVLADPALGLDGDRVGLAGGTLAVSLLARSGRFAAAVVEGARPERDAADAIATPTLVLHAEQDLETPAEHAIGFYTALRRRGVATELLLFPGEAHDLARSGRPRNRIARSEHLLRWWHRWLTDTAD